MKKIIAMITVILMLGTLGYVVVNGLFLLVGIIGSGDISKLLSFQMQRLIFAVMVSIATVFTIAHADEL